MQHPLVRVVDGGDSEAAERWDAQADYDLSVLLDQYLASHPHPPGSANAPLLADSARALRESGELRLAHLGQRRLRAT
jgi:hypothetical protein